MINLNFHDELLSTFYIIKIQSNKSEQRRKRERIYDLLNAENKSNILCRRYTKQRKIFYRNRAFKGKGMVDWSKTKKGFLSSLASLIKKDPLRQ